MNLVIIIVFERQAESVVSRKYLRTSSQGDWTICLPTTRIYQSRQSLERYVSISWSCYSRDTTHHPISSRFELSVVLGDKVKLDDAIECAHEEVETPRCKDDAGVGVGWPSYWRRVSNLLNATNDLLPWMSKSDR